MFTDAHEAFWAAARAPHGDGDGTRALVEVLLLHRHLAAAAVVAGIPAALAVGSISPEVVAVEARRAATHPSAAGTVDTDDTVGADVLTLPLPTSHGVSDGQPGEVVRRKLAGLPGERPLPSLAHYDQLLSAGPAPGHVAEPAPPAG